MCVKSCVWCIVGPSSNRTPRKKEIERKQSLDIERWLKNKVREGCHQMQEAFEAKDPKNSGVVSSLAVLISS